MTDANHKVMGPYRILISKYKWMEKLRRMTDFKYFDQAKKDLYNIETDRKPIYELIIS